MPTLLRTAGVVGLVWLSATYVVASPNFTFSDWLDPCSAPEATASPAVSDHPIQPASYSEPVAGEATAASCEDCNACCMTPACCCCEPSWYVSEGAVILHRSRPDQALIVASAAAPGQQISGAEDFGFNWGAGPDLTIARRMASGNIWEARYFGDGDAHAAVEYGTVGDLAIAQITTVAPSDLSARYFTTLHSSELNWGHPLGDRCTFLAGFRTLELRDDLSYRVVLPATTVDLSWEDHNRLYGGQIGSDLALWNLNSPLKMNASVKAGIYGNSTENHFIESPPFPADDRNGNHELAFVGEIDFSASYQLCNHVALRGGYQVLWLDNVALASDNAAASTANTTTLANIDSNGKLFYDGATAAVEFTW